MTIPVRRRAFAFALLACFVVPAVACKREERCRTCGMKIDPASGWRTELLGADREVVAVFDAPRCAFSAWRTAKIPAQQMRVPEYYSRAPGLASELRFAIGSDVIGPMGADLVPVAPEHVTKFIQDHGADRALSADEVTADVVAGLR